MPTAEDRERNIQSVIAAFIHCFKEQGTVDTNQNIIARTVNLSPRAIQRYFASKSEVAKRVISDNCGRLISK